MRLCCSCLLLKEDQSQHSSTTSPNNNEWPQRTIWKGSQLCTKWYVTTIHIIFFGKAIVLLKEIDSPQNNICWNCWTWVQVLQYQISPTKLNSNFMLFTNKQRQALTKKNNRVDWTLLLEWNGSFSVCGQCVMRKKTNTIPNCVMLVCREAWNKLGKMSKEEAMKRYIEQLEKLAPNWKEWKDTTPKAKLWTMDSFIIFLFVRFMIPSETNKDVSCSNVMSNNFHCRKKSKFTQKRFRICWKIYWISFS